MNLPDCPTPTQKYDRIVMAHGGGGRMTSRLIEKIFYPAFQNKWLEQAHDGATLNLPSARIAITTDSFVVDPLFFPGGNIGDLAINGTVNDLLCCGATPLYLSAGFILEEGLPIETLKQIVQTMRKAAGKAGVSIVTGDTKVVEHGKCDKIFINTTGVGIVPENRTSPYQERRCRNRHRRYRESRNLYSLHTRQFRFRDLYPKRYGGTHPNRL